MISWAALTQRKESKAHLLNADAEAKPYSQEELMHKQLIEGQHFSDWRKDMRKQRKELEDGYWGRAQIPLLPKDYECIQTVMPLCSAGFAEVQKKEPSTRSVIADSSRSSMPPYSHRLNRSGSLARRAATSSASRNRVIRVS